MCHMVWHPRTQLFYAPPPLETLACMQGVRPTTDAIHPLDVIVAWPTQYTVTCRIVDMTQRLR